MNLHTIITAIILCITILYLYKYIKKHEIKKQVNIPPNLDRIYPSKQLKHHSHYSKDPASVDYKMNESDVHR